MTTSELIQKLIAFDPSGIQPVYMEGRQIEEVLNCGGYVDLRGRPEPRPLLGPVTVITGDNHGAISL